MNHFSSRAQFRDAGTAAGSGLGKGQSLGESQMGVPHTHRAGKRWRPRQPSARVKWQRKGVTNSGTRPRGQGERGLEGGAGQETVDQERKPDFRVTEAPSRAQHRSGRPHGATTGSKGDSRRVRWRHRCSGSSGKGPAQQSQAAATAPTLGLASAPFPSLGPWDPGNCCPPMLWRGCAAPVRALPPERRERPRFRGDHPCSGLGRFQPPSRSQSPAQILRLHLGRPEIATARHWGPSLLVGGQSP